MNRTAIKGNPFKKTSAKNKFVDWTSTPVYKQFFLKQNEVDSLMQYAKDFAEEDFIFNEQKVRLLIKSALSNMLEYGEIDYNLRLIKNTYLVP